MVRASQTAILRLFGAALLVGFAGAIATAGNSVVTPTQQDVRVCGIVQKVTCDEKGTRNTTLEIKPRPRDVRVTILSADRARFSTAPEEALPGADVCVRGTIDSTGRDHLLIVRDAASVEVRTPAPATLAWSIPHYRLCDEGVQLPVLVREVKPTYTRDAMRAKLEGKVRLEAMITAEGRVSETRITKSLDKDTGLDRQAIVAVEQWQFTPATRAGQPVPIVVEIELSFTLR